MSGECVRLYGYTGSKLRQALPRSSVATICMGLYPRNGSSRVRHSHMTMPKEYTSTELLYGSESSSSGAVLKRRKLNAVYHMLDSSAETKRGPPGSTWGQPAVAQTEFESET